MSGNVVFRYEAQYDLVVATPRWTLATAADVTRWYEANAAYFSGRFRDAKDVIVMNAAFDVVPRLATLWGRYRTLLQERRARLYVSVASNPRLRLTANTSSAQYGVHAFEVATFDEALEVVLAPRLRETTELPATRPAPVRSETRSLGVVTPDDDDRDAHGRRGKVV
jgi:hypothetical protein